MGMRQQYVDALRNLRDSAQAVVNNWESGDLAGAVNALEGDIEEASELIAEWDDESDLDEEE